MEDIQIEIARLKGIKLNEPDFIKQMELADQIHNLEMKSNGVKPDHQTIDCIGCGS